MVDNGVASLNINIPVSYYGYVFGENKIEVIEDLYSEKNYLSITCENFKTITSANSICFKDNISGIASINDTAPFMKGYYLQVFCEGCTLGPMAPQGPCASISEPDSPRTQ